MARHWRIQDFPEVGAPNFPKNCMKLKEFGQGGVPHAPLDPPLQGAKKTIQTAPYFHSTFPPKELSD